VIEKNPQGNAKKRLLTIALVLVAFLFVTGTLGSLYLAFYASERKPPRPDLEVDALLKKLGIEEPTGILVMRGLNRGEINVLYKKVWAAGFQQERNFAIGALLEPWLAQLVMILHDEGKITFDQEVSSILGDSYAGPSGTIREFLTHSVGIVDREMNLAVDPRNLEHFTVLSQVIETVTGTPAPQLIAEKILAPLGMDGTAFQLSPESSENEEATWTTTLDDVEIWAKMLNSNRLVKFKTYLQGHTPEKLAHGKRWLYGFGWKITPWNGLRLEQTGHFGSAANYSLLRLPQKNFFVFVASEASASRFDTDSFARDVARMYVGREFARPFRVENSQP